MNNKDYVYLALGSNLGDKKQNFFTAIDKLKENGVLIIDMSALYTTPALLLSGSPSEWNIPYLNACLKVTTDKSPEELLLICKKIEKEMGRDFSQKWSPRIIDIDILHYKGQNVNLDNLTIPHKDFYNRAFWQDGLSFLFPEIVKQKYSNEHLALIMGIINITPDSFSDGGKYNNINNFIKVFNEWIQHNVNIIDIGAESTKPNARTIEYTDELERLKDVFFYLQNIKKDYFFPKLSIDTYHPETALKAIKNGFDIVNDVSGLENDKMLELAQTYKNINFVFMHNLGIPSDKSIFVDEKLNIFSEIEKWLENKLNIFEKKNIKKEQLIFDLGIGFGKTKTQDLQLLGNIEYFHKYGIKIMIGHSRKSFMKVFSNEEQRDIETLAISTAIQHKVDILRVHTPIEHQRAILSYQHLNKQFI